MSDQDKEWLRLMVRVIEKLRERGTIDFYEALDLITQATEAAAS